MNQVAPKRFNSDLCAEKHKGVNKTLSEIKKVQGEQGEDIIDLKLIVKKLTTLNENQENRGPQKTDWLNTPAGMLVLKIGIGLFIALFTIATGFNIVQFIN